MSALINSLDVFAALIAAAIHDFQHPGALASVLPALMVIGPGTNNNFQVQTESELSFRSARVFSQFNLNAYAACRYNDRAVLENMHAAEAFLLTRVRRWFRI